MTLFPPCKGFDQRSYYPSSRDSERNEPGRGPSHHPISLGLKESGPDSSCHRSDSRQGLLPTLEGGRWGRRGTDQETGVRRRRVPEGFGHRFRPDGPGTDSGPVPRLPYGSGSGSSP